MVLIEISPHDLPAIGLVATCKTLLSTLIDDWDAASCQCESECGFKQTVVIVFIKEAGCVVIFDEKCEGIWVLEMSSL